MELRTSKGQDAELRRLASRYTLLLNALLTLLLLSSGAFVGTVFAQEADIEAEAGEEATPNVMPNRPTYSNNALFYEPGYLQLETSYSARLYEGPATAVHTWNMLTTLGVIDLLEARIGWDVLNSTAGDSAVGDLMLGAKAGFFGGLGYDINLAGIFELVLPTGSGANSIDDGINVLAGLAATHLVSTFQFDLQTAIDSHIFSNQATINLPISIAATWSPINEMRFYSDLTLSLDLTNLNNTSTSFLGGIGYMVLRQLSIDATARAGLSRALPDIAITAGVTWLVGDFF